MSVKKPEVLTVEFDSNNDVCYAGQTLSGKVLVSLKHPMRAGSITLVLEGKAYTSWKSIVSSASIPAHRKDSGNSPRTVQYSGAREYIREEIVFWGKDARRSTSQLLPGLHNFPFEIKIPVSVPSSFEGRHGFVQYVCRATIRKPFKLDHVLNCPFTVIGLQNLNEDPALALPVERREESVTRRDVTSTIRLSRKGYVPGEVISINATVNNGTNDPVGPVKAKLIQVAIYYGKDKQGRQNSKEKSRVADEVTKGDVSGQGAQVWQNEGIRVPPIPPTTTDPTGVIQIQYFVQFEVGSCLQTKLPVVIGSIPLSDNNRSVAAGPSRLLSPPPTAGLMSPFDWDQLRSIPPPSYEECVFGIERGISQADNPESDSAESSEQSEHVQYSPRYVYYASRNSALFFN